MTTAPALQVQVPGLDFTELAKQAIAGELTKALIGSEEIIQKIVVAAMTEKVSSNGTKSSFSSENKITFIEWLSHSMIREAVKQAMTSRLEALRPLVEKEVDAALKRQSSKIAKSLAEGAINSLRWSNRVDIVASVSPRD